MNSNLPSPGTSSILPANLALLLQRILEFPLEDDLAVAGYASRLARENRWSLTQTRLVIGEYKRFLFLAMAAGHPVTPSEPVDQAWHLHLIYTRSYWQDLCQSLLGRPLHHEPSRGGLEEAAKFRRQYQETLTSYRRFFGEDPPPDIWPQENVRSSLLKRCRWLQSPSWNGSFHPGALTRLGLAATLTFLLAGCTGTWLGVLDWRGPEFLGAYLLALGGASLLALTWDQILRGPKPSCASPPEDLYDAALLGGGPGRAMDTALTVLLGKKLLLVSKDKKNRFGVQAATPPEDSILDQLHPLERSLWETAPRSASAPLASLRRTFAPKLEIPTRRLQETGWLFSPAKLNQLRVVRAIPFLLLFALGSAKAVIGLDRGKPAGLLIALLFLTVALIILLLHRINRRTPLGETVWQRLISTRYRPPRITQSESHTSPSDLAWMVALLGHAALSVPGYQDLQQALHHQSASSSSGGCGSGCGGGGGGGGGGCGGCGGD